jgi:uncharacterized phage protein (TIGR01671 family)
VKDIRFRAWAKYGHMFPNVQNHIGNYDTAFGNMLKSKDYIIMQFTGLQDKDGVDIYEGDIVSNKDGLHFTVGIGGYFSKESVGNGVYYYQIGEEDYWAIEANPFNKEANFTVIGNIHENKELLCED